jgi:hypothetical protein
MRRALAVLVLGACGYTPIASAPSSDKIHVVLASSNVPDAVASDEVLAGVRDELAKAGALAPGDGYPRCEVEVLRADEASEGIAATPNADGRLEPTSRATRVGVLARAWLVRSKDAPRERDTGDVRAMDTIAVTRDARAASFQQTDAVRASARRVGHRLGQRVLGLPSASDE